MVSNVIIISHLPSDKALTLAHGIHGFSLSSRENRELFHHYELKSRSLVPFFPRHNEKNYIKIMLKTLQNNNWMNILHVPSPRASTTWQMSCVRRPTGVNTKWRRWESIKPWWDHCITMRSFAPQLSIPVMNLPFDTFHTRARRIMLGFFLSMHGRPAVEPVQFPNTHPRGSIGKWQPTPTTPPSLFPLMGWLLIYPDVSSLDTW